MVTTIAVYGISREPGSRRYASIEYTLTIEEDLQEGEAVGAVLKALADQGISLFRPSGYVGDRVSVTVAVQRGEELRFIQPRDPTTQQLLSYEDIGRALWKERGAPTHAPINPTTGKWQSLADYARQERGRMVTGTPAHEMAGQRAAQIERFSSTVAGMDWKQPRSGAAWRKAGVQRTLSPYTAAYQEEL